VQKYVPVKAVVDRFTTYEESSSQWAPMTGVFDQRNPLLSIKQAARYLPAYPSYDIKSWVWRALQHVRQPEMKARIAAVPGMTESGAAAIWMYTLQGSLYPDLNAKLRSQDRAYLETHYYPYMRLLLTALRCLQSPVPRMVNRGVKRDLVSEAAAGTYNDGSRLVWWALSSTTANIQVLEDDTFLGQSGPRTIFQIHTSKGVDIHLFSSMEEAEVLLPCGTVWRVVGVYSDLHGLTIITLQEDEENGGELVV